MQFSSNALNLSLALLATSVNAQNGTAIASSLAGAVSSALRAASSTPQTFLPTLPSSALSGTPTLAPTPTSRFTNASSSASSLLVDSSSAAQSSIQDVTLTEFVPAPTTAGQGAAGTTGAADANPSLAAAHRVNSEWALGGAGLVIGVWHLL